MKSVFTTGFILTMFAVVAYAEPAAGTRDPGVNARQHHQHARIAQGARSGELTAREAHGLRKEQRAVRAEEKAYKSDGKLTTAERKDLHQDLRQTSHDIYEQKHDTETRKP